VSGTVVEQQPSESVLSWQAALVGAIAKIRESIPRAILSLTGNYGYTTTTISSTPVSFTDVSEFLQAQVCPEQVTMAIA